MASPALLRSVLWLTRVIVLVPESIESCVEEETEAMFGPIVRLPVLLKESSVVVEIEVDEAIAKRVVPKEPLANACTDIAAKGDVVPTPIKPAEVMVVV